MQINRARQPHRLGQPAGAVADFKLLAVAFGQHHHRTGTEAHAAPGVEMRRVGVGRRRYRRIIGGDQSVAASSSIRSASNSWIGPAGITVEMACL